MSFTSSNKGGPSVWKAKAGPSIWEARSGSALWQSNVSGSGLWSSGGTPGANTTLFLPFISGLQNAPTALTVNSITVAPKFQLFGSDATTTAWAPRIGAGTLAITGSGADPTPNVGTPLLGNDGTGIRYEGGKYYSSSNTNYDLTTGDGVWESVFQTDFSGVNNGYGSKRGGTPANGWDIISQASITSMRFNIFVGGSSANIQVTGWDTSTWHHIMIFVDRNEASSNGAAMYRNGVRVGTANFSGVSGDASSTSDFYMGTHSFSPATLMGFRSQAFLAMWERDAWFPGGGTNLTQWDAVAAERFRRIIGMYPAIAKGTQAPVICSRVSSAYLDHNGSPIFGRRLYRVGLDWIRAERFAGDAGEIRSSVRIEKQSTNLCPDSLVTVNATSGNTTISSNTTEVLDPERLNRADKVTESTDGAPATHTCEHSKATANITGSDTVRYCISVFAKAIDRTQFQLSPDTTANIDFDLDVDLSAGTAAVTIGDKGGIIPYGSGWYRVWVTATQSGAGSWNPQVILKSAGSNSYQGDGSDALYLWGWQVEDQDVVTSFIYTSAATATRTADALRYKGDDGNLGGVGSDLRGTVKCDVLYYAGDYPTTGSAADGCAWSISDGGSINDRLMAFNDEHQGVGGGAGGYAASYSTDAADGMWHRLQTSWSQDKNSAETRLDGVEVIDSAITTVPNDLDHIQIGATMNGTNPGNVNIGNIRIDNVDRVVD